MEEKLPLDLKKPFCTRRQKLTLLSKTADGQGLVFERPNGTGVFKTDLCGYLSPMAKTPLVYNGYFEDFANAHHRAQYTIGEVVFYARMAAKERRIVVGKVERVEKSGVIMSLFDAHALRNSAQRTTGDGTVKVPFNFVFKTPDAVRAYIASVQMDFDRAMTTYRSLMSPEQPSLFKPTPQQVPFRVKRTKEKSPLDRPFAI